MAAYGMVGATIHAILAGSHRGILRLFRLFALAYCREGVVSK